MALVGGGGAGNVASSNPAGTGTTLNYVGDFAYAYSGEVGVDDNETTLLEFNTGNNILVGTFQHMYFADSADNYRWFLYLDGSKIGAAATGSLIETDRNEIELVIPPYSNIRISAQNFADSSSNNMGALVVGRIY